MRGEWDGNNDRSRALRVSFRSFLFFSTNRQVHSQASYDTHLECSYHSELSLLYSWLHLNWSCLPLLVLKIRSTLFRLTTSVLGGKNSSINSLYQSLIAIKTHERCIFYIDGLLSSDRGDSEASNGYGASRAMTLQTKFLSRTVEPRKHLTSPKKSFGQSRFATGGFRASWRWFASKHFSFHCISKYTLLVIKVESLQRHIFIELTQSVLPAAPEAIL